jgi:alpha-1,3-rhamnosyl/mannosyltransferase
MRFIVNALPLTGLLTGISRYVRCLYAEIEKIPGVQVVYFTGEKLPQRMPAQAEPVSWSQATDRIWRLPDALVVGLRSAHWLNFERKLRNVCKQNNFSIYHETAFVPAALTTVPVIYTLHDLSLIDHSAKHPRERVWFFNLFFNRRISYAAHIITVSEFMRGEIIEKLKIRPDAVTTIYEAPDPYFYPRPQEQVAQICRQHGWPNEYVLFVGTLEPRKNVGLLISALSRMKNKTPLILAGWKGWGDKQWLHDMHALDLEKRIYIANYVDEETLACLYSGARAFIYPSLYEGFGLPVLEAMACGCPVVCSHVASLPEVAGDAALYIYPLDADELAHQMDRMLEDSMLHNALSGRGLERAKTFTWQMSAVQTAKLFNTIAEQHKRTGVSIL